MKKYNVLPCPCCGSEDIYCGPHDADAAQVKCRNCGLRIIEWLPSQMPPGVQDDWTPQQCINHWYSFGVKEAIKKWNVRRGSK